MSFHSVQRGERDRKKQAFTMRIILKVSSTPKIRMKAGMSAIEGT